MYVCKFECVCVICLLLCVVQYFCFLDLHLLRKAIMGCHAAVLLEKISSLPQDENDDDNGRRC